MLLLMLFHVPKASSLHAVLTLFYIELKKKNTNTKEIRAAH